jgi:hypothetical protein
MGLGGRIEYTLKTPWLGIDINLDAVYNLDTGQLDVLLSAGPEGGGAGTALTGGILIVGNCPTNNFLDQPGLDLDLVYGGGTFPVGPVTLTAEGSINPDTNVTVLYIGGGSGAEAGPNIGASIVFFRIRLLGGDY